MNDIEEIKSRLDIVDIIGQYVSLQKAGRTFKAPCPFHTEKTPSFIVSPDRQMWHCFGACGTGGDVISFVMRREGLEFRDALRTLAERAGVRLKEYHRSPEEERKRERLQAANEAAAAHFWKLLNSDAGRQAREYIERRGIDTAAAKEFLLGYSAPAWEDLRQELTALGFAGRELLEAGLLVEGEKGPHDRFRGRLMFGIRDVKGRVIGFGARALDGSQPKYINTSQTTLFDKGGTLYALDRAQAGIKREGRAVVVEGYMDAIAAHQAGFDNVVAQMGTALTERQVRLLKKLTGVIVLALDADAAGREAAVRGHEVVREAAGDGETAPVVSWRGLAGYQEAASVDLRVAVLPEGRDPDDVIRADPEAWRALIDGSQPVLDFRFQAALARHDMSDPRGRSAFVQEFVPLIGAVTDPVVRAHYLQRASRAALVKEEELSGMLRRTRGGPERPRAAGAKPAAAPGAAREEFLLALLLRYPELRGEGLAVAEDLLWETENRQILAAWKVNSGLEAVKEVLPPELAPHLERLSLRELPPLDAQVARAALTDCIQRLRRRALEAEKQAITALLATREEEIGLLTPDQAMGDEERLKELVELQVRDTEAGLKLHGKERGVRA
jgi:DNA primase